MDYYKNILRTQLLSELNINFLVSIILTNFKISSKAVTKCIKIITGNLNKYLENIDRYPENNNELVDAIEFLNKKCYDDFTICLSKKYPGMNLLRNPFSQLNQSSNQFIQPLQPPLQQPLQLQQQPLQLQQQQFQSLQSQPQIRSLNSTAYDSYSTRIVSNQACNDQCIEEIIILTPEEKNKLVKSFSSDVNKVAEPKQKISPDDFLTYLTNPLALQMFNVLCNQMKGSHSNLNVNSNPNSNPTTNTQDTPKVDMILDGEQVKLLIEKHNQKSIIPPEMMMFKPTPIKQVKKVDVSNNILANENFNDALQNDLDPELLESESLDPGSRGNEENLNEDGSNVEVDTNDESESVLMQKDMSETVDKSNGKSIPKTTNKSKKINDSPESNKLDISKGLTKEMLPLVKSHIEGLVKQKEIYKRNHDYAMIDKIDDEIKKIRQAVTALKDDYDRTAKENSEKLKTISMSYSKRDGADNIEYLDLRFDPSNDFNDLKDIVIKFKSENKIVDITLIDYYLPFNINNVTRFNNKFAVIFNGISFRFTIPPAKYDIESILEYIKSQANFLDFIITDNKIITIKNIMNMKFDLLITQDSIFQLLGFTSKMEGYREKTFYVASQPYDIACNEKCHFLLSGTPMEPLEMEFDKNVELNKSLRRSRSGIVVRQLNLSFTNAVNQCYDFIIPFKMCLKLTYVEN